MVEISRFVSEEISETGRFLIKETFNSLFEIFLILFDELLSAFFYCFWFLIGLVIIKIFRRIILYCFYGFKVLDKRTSTETDRQGGENSAGNSAEDNTNDIPSTRPTERSDRKEGDSSSEKTSQKENPPFLDDDIEKEIFHFFGRQAFYFFYFTVAETMMTVRSREFYEDMDDKEVMKFFGLSENLGIIAKTCRCLAIKNFWLTVEFLFYYFIYLDCKEMFYEVVPNKIMTKEEIEKEQKEREMEIRKRQDGKICRAIPRSNLG